MINTDQLRTLIIRPTLEAMDAHSPAAENLLMGTVAQESLMGTFLKQHPTGPALGIYQMEPATHDDIWSNYLDYREPLARSVSQHLPTEGGHGVSKAMIGNLYYATAMARVHYIRVPHPLPDADDIAGLALYWKTHYNTPQGKGSVDEFIRHYKAYVSEK